MANTTESITTSVPVSAPTPVVVPGDIGATDDVYYVNNNEITGNSIVGEILTGRENFVKWKKAMRIALSARLKFGFVEGEHPRPTDPALKARWQCCNDVIMLWLLCSVSTDVTRQILDATDVADAWNILYMMYAGSNLSKNFTLQQEITNLMQGTMTVAKYFEVLCGFWRELDAMRERRGCSIFDDCVRCQDSAKENLENKVMKFLMGLNEFLAQIRTHILALEKLPSLNVVFDRMQTLLNKYVPNISDMMQTFLKYFLEIEVARSTKGIFINQRKYVLDILEDHNLTEYKPVQTPLEAKHGLSLSTASPINDPTTYRRLVGRLIYLTILLFVASSDLRLSGYCDADWAVVPSHAARSPYIVCYLVPPLFLGNRRSKQSYPAPPLSPNIALWQLLVVKLCGFFVSWLIWAFRSPLQSHYIATANQRFILPAIRSFTSAPNTLKLTVILSGNSSTQARSNRHRFIRLNNL